MNRLHHVILFTPDITALRAFYADTLGLNPGGDDLPHWVDFRTSGAVLALHPTSEGIQKQVQLSFQVEDIETEVRAMQARGVVFEDELTEQPHGRLIHLRDPEGNWLSLIEPAWKTEPRPGPALNTVILNVRDLAACTMFYREKLELSPSIHQPNWVEFDTGDARLALHTRATGLNHPLHAVQRVAPCFEAPELETWMDAVRERGATLATNPTTEDFGLYAEIVDPDGNVLVFREPPEPPSLEEQLAEAFEDPDAPHVVGIRRPAHKAGHVIVKATERKPVEPRKPLSATTQPVAKVRGAGPERTRLAPKKTGDEKKAKAKPMQGRLRKLGLQRAESKRLAVAVASKAKPVRRAASIPAGRAAPVRRAASMPSARVTAKPARVTAKPARVATRSATRMAKKPARRAVASRPATRARAVPPPARKPTKRAVAKPARRVATKAGKRGATKRGTSGTGKRR